MKFKEAHDEELKVQKGKQKSALGKNGWPNQEVHDAMKNSWQPVEEESHIPWEVHVSLSLSLMQKVLLSKT